MSTIQWLIRVTRPVVFLAAGLASWAIAIICNGPGIFSSNKVAAGIAMALNCLAASVFHFGAANKMYARKVWDVVPVKSPWKLVSTGLSLFASSLFIAWTFLPRECVWVIELNILILVLYSGPLSSTWWTKNWTMAYVCSTPILFGWLAGSHPSPILPYAYSGVFCLYWCKEIIKDIYDIRANCGIRVTLPIKFGIREALRVAGALAGLGTLCITPMLLSLGTSTISIIALLCAICLFSLVSWKLFSSSEHGNTHKMITFGSYCLIVSVAASRL